MNTQEKIKSLIKETKQLEYKIFGNQDDIRKYAFDVLSELQSIEGWKLMIENCRSHYDRYPNEFFKWCEVQPTINNTIQFIKGYSDGSDYVVLEIDLNKSLHEQVNIAIKKYRISQEETEDLKKKFLKQIEDEERKELKRLKEKYGE